jgi:DNA-binding response OmpR family regulator
MQSARPILLVEDDPSQAKLMMRAFDKAGVGSRIFHVNNGEQVLGYISGIGRYFDRSKFPMPVLIVLDLRLPDLPGLQLLNVMRSQPASKRIPVVVFSGSGDDKMIAAAYDAGANSYIPKGGSFKQMSDVVAAMVNYWLNVNHVPDAPRVISIGARGA